MRRRFVSYHNSLHYKSPTIASEAEPEVVTLSVSSRVVLRGNGIQKTSHSHLAFLSCRLPGNADEVRCFFCDGRVGRWQYNDDPMTKHRQLFPDCGFVRLVAEVERETPTSDDVSILHRDRLYSVIMCFQTCRH